MGKRQRDFDGQYEFTEDFFSVDEIKIYLCEYNNDFTKFKIVIFFIKIRSLTKIRKIYIDSLTL